MIYHVYWGTAGNMGLYLDEIYQSLQAEGFSQKVFVNYYYPFNYGHKVFFKFTELGHGLKQGTVRNAVRYLELIYALTRIYISIRRHKPEVVNYSFIGVFTPVVLFLKLIKKTTRCQLVLTCHDVMPFENGVQALSKQEQMRKACFQLADFLLVHNNHSASQLVSSFGIAAEKILCHPFPVMDLRKLYPAAKPLQPKYDFLFLGHLRREKGIEVLLAAWRKFHAQHPEARLCIAGSNPFGLNPTDYDGENIDFVLHFLSEEEYFTLARQTRYVVLPYTEGTNSGVVSTLATLVGTNIITSDLEMFTSNPLLNREYMFKASDSTALCEKLSLAYESRGEAGQNMADVERYRSHFGQEVVALYRRLVQS